MKHRWLLGSAVLENLLQDIVVRSIRENADFQSRSGMTPKIIRKTDGNCCEWCSQMAGEYSYPDVPDDVYRRHKNCTCTVEYYPGDGRKQNVWTKKWDDNPDLRERRKKVGLKEQDPGVLALRRSVGLKESGQEKLERRKRIGVENDGNGGTIKTGRPDLSRYIGKPIIETDNKSIREWYVANVSDIPNQIDRSKPLEEQVEQAYELRNKYKHEARAAMSDEKTAKTLEELHPVKSFEDLLKDKMERKNMSKEEALTDMLKTASKTNKNVNREFGM